MKPTQYMHRLLVLLLLVLGTAHAQSPVTTSVKKLSLFGLVTIYNHSDVWMRVDLQIDECQNVAWITCGQIISGLDIAPRGQYTAGVFVDDVQLPYSFKPAVNWYEPNGPRNWRHQYADLSPNRLARKQVQNGEFINSPSKPGTSAGGSGSNSGSSPPPNTAQASAQQTPPSQQPPAQPPKQPSAPSYTPPAASSQSASSECGSRGEIRWIDQPSDIPKSCYSNREQNWVSGNDSSVDPKEVCQTATRPHSNGMPVPQEYIKNMSACFCGRNLELSGSTVPLRCWNFYDLK